MNELSLARFRVCNVCGVFLPATAVHYHRDRTDLLGLRRTCKQCSRRLGATYKKKQAVIPKTCRICGDVFRVPYGSKEQLHCSRTCYYKSLKPEYYPRADTSRQCPQCGKNFYAEQRRISFCSKSCANSWNKNPGGRGKGKIWLINCAQCGIQFKKVNATTKFCSRECHRLSKLGVTPQRIRDHESKPWSTRSEQRDEMLAWDMLESQDGLCAYCETVLFGQFEVDHMVPQSRGGTNHWSNLAVSCMPCNRRKSARTAEEFWEAHFVHYR